MHYTFAHKSQSWLWFLAPDYGTVIGNTIFMPDRFFSMPEPDRTAWMKHEETHIEQHISWCRYLTSAAYRREVETEAYRVQVQYLLSHGRTPRIDEWARIMSDYWPLNWITEVEAVRGALLQGRDLISSCLKGQAVRGAQHCNRSLLCQTQR